VSRVAIAQGRGGGELRIRTIAPRRGRRANSQGVNCGARGPRANEATYEPGVGGMRFVLVEGAIVDPTCYGRRSMMGSRWSSRAAHEDARRLFMREAITEGDTAAQGDEA